MSSDRLRVCVITGGHWAAVMGGAQYQAKCLVDEMIAEGTLDVIYLAKQVNPDFRPVGYDLLQIAKPSAWSRKSFLLDAPALTKCLREVNPDVVYQRGLQPYTGVAARFCRRHGRRFIFQIAHDFDVSRSGWEAQEWRRPLKGLEMSVARYGLRRADHVIAQTRRQAELLQTNFGIRASGIMGNFHPLPAEQPLKASSPLQVAWIANFKPFKRPEVFVDLAEELSDLRDVRFVMIGRLGDERRYRGLVERIRSLGNIDYLGELPLDDVNSVLASSHVFVNTSTAEGFPNTFVQSWLRRAVVVSLDVDTDGVLETERGGFLARNREQLGNIVRKLATEPSLRESMATQAESYARTHHSSRNASVLLDLIRRPSGEPGVGGGA